MRVLISAESFLPSMDGVVNSVLRVLEHLDRLGHTAHVIAPAPGPTSVILSSGTYVAVERVPGVNVPFYRSKTVGCVPTRRLERVFDDFRPDIVHLAAPVVLGRQVGRVAADRGIRSVALFQTDLVGFAGDYGFGLVAAPLWHLLRTVHNRADLTLAPTQVVADQLTGVGFHRTAVWGRGVDHHQFSRSRRSEEFRATCNARTGDVLVGYVGRLASEKRVDHLRSVSSIPGVKLVIVGEGPQRERLQQVLPNAHFTGFLSGDELGEAVASLDVFVHTGIHETFCQSIQEAMAAGVPVVAAASGGPTELVRHLRTGLLYSPERPSELRKYVGLLAADDVKRRRMGAEAEAAVADRTWFTVGEELMKYYERVITLTHSSRKTADILAA